MSQNDLTDTNTGAANSKAGLNSSVKYVGGQAENFEPLTKDQKAEKLQTLLLNNNPYIS